MKLKVGDKIWYVEQNRKGVQPDPKETTITKVGNKYFEIDCCFKTKFEISTKIIVSEYNNYSRCYLNIQEYYDEQERSQIISYIQKSFQWNSGVSHISLEQLRQIKQIISQ